MGSSRRIALAEPVLALDHDIRAVAAYQLGICSVGVGDDLYSLPFRGRDRVFSQKPSATADGDLTLLQRSNLQRVERSQSGHQQDRSLRRRHSRYRNDRGSGHHDVLRLRAAFGAHWIDCRYHLLAGM